MVKGNKNCFYIIYIISLILYSHTMQLAEHTEYRKTIRLREIDRQKITDPYRPKIVYLHIIFIPVESSGDRESRLRISYRSTSSYKRSYIAGVHHGECI